MRYRSIFKAEARRRAAKLFPVPLRRYVTEILARFSPSKRYLVIYDQLKPAYAKYYKNSEVKKLLQDAGFEDIKLYHRHGYSWTAIATKGPNTTSVQRNASELERRVSTRVSTEPGAAHN